MKIIALLMCAAAALANSALAAEAKKAPEITSEQRQKMAGIHDKMASCLRSERPVSECHEEMKKGCGDTMGKDGCPMMGGKMGHGKHHHHDED